MSLELRLGLLGVALAFFAIAASILWPDKKWIGWVSFFAAALVLCWWGWLEFGPRMIVTQKQHPVRLGLIIFFASGFIGVALWQLLLPQTKPGAPNTAEDTRQPACYIFPFGQVIDGRVNLVIANQTPNPVDDVDLDLAMAYSNSPEQEPKTLGWTKHLNWGTCKALLTSGINESFYIGNHPRVEISIFATTRSEGGFVESISFRRKPNGDYDAETKFYRRTGQKPFSEQMTLTASRVKRPKK